MKTRTSKSIRPQHRRGFTLMELLLVIAIMAVMATMSLGLMRSATEDAKESATLSRISQIEALMQVELENYEVRRLPVSMGQIKSVSGNNYVNMKNLRYQIIADIISAELPYPYFETTKNEFKPLSNRADTKQVGDYPASTDTTFNAKFAMFSPTPLAPAAAARWTSIRTKYPSTLYPSDDTAVPPASKLDLPAEYLYEIVRNIDYDGTSGVEGLGNAAIGDSDNDGIPEIVDSWGDPLDFRIEQIKADFVSNAWVDRNPVEYEPLDVATPRSMQKIRFVVFSSHVN